MSRTTIHSLPPASMMGPSLSWRGPGGPGVIGGLVRRLGALGIPAGESPSYFSRSLFHSLARLVVLCAVIVPVLASSSASAGWVLVKRVVRSQTKWQSDVSLLPPGGGKAEIWAQANGWSGSARGNAVDWTLLDSVQTRLTVAGLYIEKWKWIPDPGLEPYAEMKFRSIVERAVVNVPKADGSAEVVAEARMRIRVGGRLFESQVKASVTADSNECGGTVNAGPASGIGISLQPSGIGQPGSSEEGGYYDQDEGDVCRETTLLDKRFTKVSAAVMADGGLFGRGESYLDALVRNQRVCLSLGSIANCVEKGGGC